ncbi:hypothetical protein SAMN04487917_1221, partial [Arthrobacter sp. yr096]
MVPEQQPTTGSRNQQLNNN